MPWNAPVTPIPGTVITVAYAVSNIVNPVNWLRQMTGNADPGAANLALVSTGPTGTAWGLIQDATLAVQKVTRAGDVMTGDLQVNRAGAASPSTGYVVLGNNTAHFVGFDGANVVADGSRVWTDANAPATSLVPSGLIGAFRTAAAIPAGWARCDGSGGRPNMNGRMPVGAGVTFGQTFTEDTAAGAGSWTHNHGPGAYVAAATTGGAVQSGGASTANPQTHTHTITGTGGDATWIPPAFVVVWAIRS